MKPPLRPMAPKPRYGEIFLAVRPALNGDFRLAWSVLKGLGAAVLLIALVFVIVGTGGA
jgi:hypothetical protein